MKSFKLKNMVMIALFVMMQVVAFANDGNPDKSKVVVESNSTAIALSLQNLEKQATAIALKNADSEVLFDRKVKNRADLGLRLDVSQLLDGNYSLVIDRKHKAYIQALELKNGEVLVGKMIEIVKPTIVKNKKGFTVSNPNASIKSVEIVNESGETIYAKAYTAKDAKATKIRYLMKSVAKGYYIVKVVTSYDVYYKNINLK